MVTWNFPETIRSNSEATVNIEFSHRIFRPWSADQGTVIYRLTKDELTFTIRAIHTVNGGSKPDIQFVFENFANLGSVVVKNLWKEDGESVFDLQYDQGKKKYYSGKIIGGSRRDLAPEPLNRTK